MHIFLFLSRTLCLEMSVLFYFSTVNIAIVLDDNKCPSHRGSNPLAEVYFCNIHKQTVTFVYCLLSLSRSASGCCSVALLSRAECIVLLLGSVNRERFVFNKAPKQTVEQLTLLLHGAHQTMWQNKDMRPW